MKVGLTVVAACYIIVFWIGRPVKDVIFSGESVESDPLYIGIVLFSGLIIGAAVYMADTNKKKGSK